MRTILLASLLLFAAPVAVVAQVATVPAAAPFKGANALLLPGKSDDLKALARVFVQQGFTIDKLDTDLGYLTTTPRPYGQITPASFAYRAVLLPDSTLQLTGTFTVRVGLRDVTDSMFWSRSTLLQGRQCFDRAGEVAQAFAPGAAVRYTVVR